MQILNSDIESYIASHSSLDSSLEIIENEIVKNLGFPTMSIGSYESLFLQFIVQLINPDRVLEVGTFGGLSATAMLKVLKKEAKLVTCEINPEHAKYAQELFNRQGYSKQVEIILGNATETLKTLQPYFDFIFIDADKTNYLKYYEFALKLISPKGLIAVDNTLWSARVLDDKDDSDDTKAIKEFNDFVVKDSRVKAIMLPVRDGLTLIKKLPVV
jgi:caffeoyl-CoA O-methyltransferase